MKKNLFYREPDEGNLEYKLNLLNFTYEKFQRYSTQLLYRILEGEGKAIYIIGVKDNGEVNGIKKCEIDNTINKFNYICSNVNCSMKLILRCNYENKDFLIIKAVADFDLDSFPFIF